MNWAPFWLMLALACSPKPVATPPATTGVPVGTPAGTASGSPATPGGTTTQLSPLQVQVLDATWTTEVGSMATVRAQVSSTDPEPISVSFTSDQSGDLGSAVPDAKGEVVLNTDTLPPAWHEITVEATQGVWTESALATVGICEWPALEDFSAGASISGWTLFGNAAWDPQGWLEITGNIQSSDGAIFKVDRLVNAGDVAIEFEIATGGGLNGGADGFTVSVIAAYDQADLTNIVNTAGLGGCLGYGTSGACGNLPINAFHIEFDTWYNPELSDPTDENHIAIALNGDPAPLLWAAVPTLEDLVWRHVRVEILGSDVTVYVDGSLAIQGTLPGFKFDGGFIGVSGATGWASNFHRFDNLQLFDQCSVPSTTTTSSP